MKPVAVLDSSVVVSGIGWRGGDARAVLRLLAVRGFISARTPWLSAEWLETVERVAREEKRWRNKNWRAWLDWLNHASVCFEEIPIRVTVRRDPKDDPVVMAARYPPGGPLQILCFWLDAKTPSRKRAKKSPGLRLGRVCALALSLDDELGECGSPENGNLLKRGCAAGFG